MAKFFGKDDIFNLDKDHNGLQIAFGLTDYPMSANEILYEPEYGEITLTYTSWGLDDHVNQQIEIRPCNDEELGLGPQGFSSPQSKFYPMNSNGSGWLRPYARRL